MLRPARESECEALSALCFRSKAVWGYDTTFMEACRADLTVSRETLLRATVVAAEIDGSVVGVAEVRVANEVASLEKLFVDPAALRCGVGEALFQWAKSLAAEQGARVLAIESDPHAAAFYRRMGAIDDGLAPSGAIPGRMLPRLRLTL